jgi:hypothetical protein
VFDAVPSSVDGAHLAYRTDRTSSSACTLLFPVGVPSPPVVLTLPSVMKIKRYKKIRKVSPRVGSVLGPSAHEGGQRCERRKNGYGCNGMRRIRWMDQISRRTSSHGLQSPAPYHGKFHRNRADFSLHSAAT